jgi:serine protease Do
MKRIAIGLWFFIFVCGQISSEAKVDSHRENDVVRAVRAAKDAVVNISTNIVIQPEEENDIFQFFWPEARPEQAHSLGSGFIIHKDGYIITNAHVVQRASEIIVSFADKSSVKAESWYTDDVHDLAVIKIKPKKELPVLPMGRGDDLMIGETVIAIGNALGYQHTVTTGVVSAVDRTLTFSRGQEYKGLIQTDASINPGNSGGPLLNIDGELIGINTAIRGDAQNIGFAINVDILKRILPDLLSAENIRRANMGFRLATDSGNQIRVISVEEKSPADRAGIRAGDLITRYDGRSITQPVDFYVAMLEKPMGGVMKLDLMREKEPVTVTMPFAAKPKPNGRALAKAKLGLILKELTEKEASEMGLGSRKYLIVEKAISGYPAYNEAGIREGDILNSLNGSRISTFDEAGQILEQTKSGETIGVGVMRIRGNMLYSTTVGLRVK